MKYMVKIECVEFSTQKGLICMLKFILAVITIAPLLYVIYSMVIGVVGTILLDSWDERATQGTMILGGIGLSILLLASSSF